MHTGIYMAVPSGRETPVEAGLFLYLFCLFITYPQSLVEREQLPREFAGAELDMMRGMRCIDTHPAVLGKLMLGNQ